MNQERSRASFEELNVKLNGDHVPDAFKSEYGFFVSVRNNELIHRNMSQHMINRSKNKNHTS